MKAYKNEKGCIMAVFKDRNDKYGVYYRQSENDDFKKPNCNYPSKATREEAEADMHLIVRRSEGVWELIEFKG